MTRVYRLIPLAAADKDSLMKMVVAVAAAAGEPVRSGLDSLVEPEKSLNL